MRWRSTELQHLPNFTQQVERYGEAFPVLQHDDMLSFEDGLAVEMQSAALYAFAAARKRAVLCLAHVTNCMAKSDGDFEKSEAAASLSFRSFRDSQVDTAPDAWKKTLQLSTRSSGWKTGEEGAGIDAALRTLTAGSGGWRHAKLCHLLTAAARCARR